jgi:monomeric sarcosine oxidase
MNPAKTYDVAVIGAGVFGAWTAHALTGAGLKVILLDAYGAAHNRASSGGESRIIRLGYGDDEIYTRWSQQSLDAWKALAARCGQPLFHETGVLWMASGDTARLDRSAAVLTRLGLPFESLDAAELAKRYPQIAASDVRKAILEPGSGSLMARRAVFEVVREAGRQGMDFAIAQVLAPEAAGKTAAVRTARGESIAAGHYVYACGPWLGKVFPALLGSRIFVTRQEVVFLGVPPGDARFAPPALPTWIDADSFYGMPDLESRGFKVANDVHGPRFDPDHGDRQLAPGALEPVREFLRRRFPDLAGAPVVESRVCQYENTSNGDFLIDRHPEHPNVWLAGGGSGHGFKHGPAFGAYLAARITGSGEAEPRFSLAGKATVQQRAVF